MLISRTLSLKTEKGIALALGTFDGLHLGHQAVLSAALQSCFIPAVLTFDVHPRKILQQKQPPLLLTEEDKSHLLENMGFSAQFLLDFSAVRLLTPTEFLDWVCSRLPIRLLSCGYNYRFGKEGVGDAAFLENYGKKRNIQIHVSPPVKIDSLPVSSTRIRTLLEKGDAEAAAALLGRRFSFCLPVVGGDQRGRTIGFPTINQFLPEELIRPRFGVYVSRTEIDGRLYPSVTNLGIRPTYRVNRALSETYIIGFEGNLYGRRLRVELLHFLREETKFGSLDDLKNAIEKNKKDALYFTGRMP